MQWTAAGVDATIAVRRARTGGPFEDLFERDAEASGRHGGRPGPRYETGERQPANVPVTNPTAGKSVGGSKE